MPIGVENGSTHKALSFIGKTPGFHPEEESSILSRAAYGRNY